ncbi:hypothetical protein CRM22_004569 [Opisthorchis felineus]|uniref:Death domain-containing protein n=1 Tax=Opisthorchis felineus TaxID=147828 RepID=A0A4S2LVI6_OPIFE|nr:hypothetical protein CRM22_004569 [Opisthorchis felineus]
MHLSTPATSPLPSALPKTGNETKTVSLTTMTPVETQPPADDIWMDGWPKKLTINGSSFYPPVQTAFHIGDYTRYEQNGEASDTSSKQNQMLPIYCSIMGFIIVFLLLYVVYKLWKQREAMTNAKLCEVYTSSGYSTVKLPVNSAQMDSVLNGPCDGDGGGAADHVKSENISRLTTKHLCGANRQQERDPLIANFETGANELSYLEIQLVTLQRDVLGMICFQLSRSGWREMATNMDIPTTSLLGPSANDSEFATQLAQAAQEAKHLILKESTTQNSPDEDTIKASARLLAKLCQQPTANVRVLLTELERINRGDIVAFISDKLTSSPAIPISPWSATKDPRV